MDTPLSTRTRKAENVGSSGWNGRKIGGGKRRNVGDKKEKKTRTEREEVEDRRGSGKTRKVETTCRNNVRVFDLRHVTEPH